LGPDYKRGERETKEVAARLERIRAVQAQRDDLRRRLEMIQKSEHSEFSFGVDDNDEKSGYDATHFEDVEGLSRGGDEERQGQEQEQEQEQRGRSAERKHHPSSSSSASSLSH
jgi:hypothetical protein